MNVRCPHCGKPVVWDHNPFRPFCSERCRLIDLGKWATGEHRIPGEPATPDAEADGDGDDKDDGA